MRVCLPVLILVFLVTGGSTGCGNNDSNPGVQSIGSSVTGQPQPVALFASRPTGPMGTAAAPPAAQDPSQGDKTSPQFGTGVNNQSGFKHTRTYTQTRSQVDAKPFSVGDKANIAGSWIGKTSQEIIAYETAAKANDGDKMVLMQEQGQITFFNYQANPLFTIKAMDKDFSQLETAGASGWVRTGNLRHPK